MSEKKKQEPTALKGSIRFVPSRELTEARQLLDLATSSGHRHITLRPEDLESYFTVMEQEEKKVFDLQQSVGELAIKNAQMHELLADLVADQPTYYEQDEGEACAFCMCIQPVGEEVEDHHADNCLITQARGLL